MNKKKQAIIITLLFIAVIVLVAMNSTVFSLKFDITENKVFSITENSKKIMRQLPEQMTITYFLTEKLKAYDVVYRQIEDILKQYAASSDGKVKLNIIDPSEDPEKQKLATDNGIQISEQGTRESRSSANIFLAASGLLVEYRDQNYPLPSLNSISTLEYDLTAFIQSIIQERSKTIGYIIKKDDWDYNQFDSILNEVFQHLFKTERIIPGQPIPDTIDALLVIGNSDLVESEVFEIDQYIMKGGKVFFSIDALQQAQPPIPFENPFLLKMLERYGAKILPGFVMEPEEALTRIQTQQGTYIYPYFFQGFAQNASKNNPITAHFNPIYYEWTSPIEVDPPLGVESEVLNTSTKKAVKVMDTIEMDPQRLSNLYQSLKNKAEKMPLLVALKGSFNSYFQGKEIPNIKKEDTTEVIYSSIPTRIVIIGNSNFLNPQFRNQQVLGLFAPHYYSTNMNFFATAMQWLTNSEDLVAIKTRANRDKSLGKIESNEDFNAWSGFATYFNLIFIPLIVMLFGIIKYMLRKKAKNEK